MAGKNTGVARGGDSAAPHARFVPAALALAAAVAALAVGLALERFPASRDAAAPPQTAMTDTPPAAAPADLLADLDFYLWLSQHETARSLPPGSS